MTRAAPSTRASATLPRAAVRMRCTVPRETPMLFPASSCVRPSWSQRRSASSSSRCSSICRSSLKGMRVGLKARPQSLPWQCRSFFGRGNGALPQYILAHSTGKKAKEKQRRCFGQGGENTGRPCLGGGSRRRSRLSANPSAARGSGCVWREKIKGGNVSFFVDKEFATGYGRLSE